ARQLIEEANVIKVIVDTVMELLREHLDASNHFFFPGYSPDKFSRIRLIFHDLRYILISKPSVWTEELRTQFVEGFKVFLKLLKCMQGMEEVKRQFGQHIALEPEWEAGFYLQIQLRHILAMFQDWCSSDVSLILTLAFKECHKVLMQCTNQPFQQESVDYYMCKHILNVRPYKVSQQPVSIHLPITRLLAEWGPLTSLDYTQLAEPALRCVVLAAQVSAEMWRRNGLSLVSQVYYYQDVKCRDEMYDKDILMLQIAASRMEPNHFLMWILLRFELFDHFNGNFSSKDQDELFQWNRLIEEMLYLLIVIIGERYVPGVSYVTKEDVTMREVIHLLCIEPMAHSSLVKGLPENEYHETGLESVITKVATFKKPGVSGHGLYEVKKECLVEFNPFFYHYSRIQHSKAEESQKKRRAQECNDKALCPPVPPAFCPAFSSVVHLLHCDIFIHILRRVLQKATEDRTEAMVQRALHLIGQALLEEKTQLEDRTVEDVTFDFTLKARKHGKSVFHMLSRLKEVPSLEAQKDMVKWLLQMFEIVKCLRDKSSPTASVSMEPAKPEERAQDKEKAERKRKAEAAKLHRQKIMAQMSAMQKNFIESNKMLYENMPEICFDSSSCAMAQMDLCVAIGPHRGSTPAEREVLTCILCQEEQEVGAKAQAMVLTACVQRSTVLTQCRGKIPVSRVGPYPLFMSPYLALGTHTGSCGHVMHATYCTTEDRSADVDALLGGESQPDYRSILSYGVQEPMKFSDSIMEMLGVCATTVHRVGLQTAPNELCPRVPLMAWITCAFTIQAIENILQEEEKPLFGSLQNRQLAGLKAIVQFSAVQRLKCSQAVIQSHFSEMLAVLLPVIRREHTPSVLDVDFFHLLVGLVLSIPSLYQEETVDLQPSAVSSAYNHMHILHLVTMAHMLQILLSSTGRDDESYFPSVAGGEETVEARAAAELCSTVSQHTGRYSFFRWTTYSMLIKWCNILTLNKAPKDKFQTVRYPRRRNRLIDLPEDYSALLNQASHFQCPKSTDDEKKHPTLCLFCGAMLCSQSFCCLSQVDGEDVGACNAHAASCGAGVGMFLRVRECEIVLMANTTRGCTYPAPYLDDYGETDPHLGRGNPLHLCPERYRKLNQLWQHHCILEEIARRLEVVNVMFAFEWQML
uniref:E3 ubiquitin-protein ligase n=1 Tax=Takifugu rubripes TaxID=31033 RepID=A0A674MXA0_TAKRU